MPRDLGAIVTERTGPYHRPVVMLSFALDRAVWDSWPPGFHLTNVLAHGVVAALVATLAARLGLGAGVATLAGLVVVAHPVETEAVTYVSGRTDVLAAVFLLTGLLAWRRARRAADVWAVATTAALVAALLAKEAVAAIPLVLLLPGAHPADRPPRPILPLLATVAWLAATIGAGAVPGPGGLVARLPAIGAAALQWVGLLLWPVDLHLERFTPVTGWSAPATLGIGLGVLGVLAALGLAARRVRGGDVLLGVALLAWLPGSGVVPIYPAIADRALFTPEHFLYLPLLGLAPLLAGAAAAAVPPTRRRATLVAFGLLVTWWTLLTIDRNRDWRDEATLFRHTVAHHPPVARVWFNLGNLELGAGRLDEAARLYETAIALEPGAADALRNLGVTRLRQGDHQAAAAAFRAAERLRRD